MKYLAIKYKRGKETFLYWSTIKETLNHDTKAIPQIYHTYTGSNN